jgi:hypothetical protein
LYVVEPSTDGRSGKLFQQPKFGGDGWLGPETARFDGYSAVVTWPDQSAVLVDDATEVSMWPGMNLEGGYFIQNGYATKWSHSGACTGQVWVEIFRSKRDVATLVLKKDSPYGTFCRPGERLQFKAERLGTVWVFSYRVVSADRATPFVEQARHDFRAVRRGVGHVQVRAEMYDYHDSVERVSPVTFGPVLVKAQSQWQPVDRMTHDDDFGGERVFLRPEPERGGVTTSAPGPRCYGSTSFPKETKGLTLWDATTRCVLSQVECDGTTGACR